MTRRRRWASTAGASSHGEEQVRKALPERHLIVRTAWLFGDHGANFVKTMLRLGRERDQLKVVNDQTGSPTYAGHLAAALKSLAENRLSDPGVYHMTNCGHCTWYEFACEIFRLAGVDVDLKRTTTEEYQRSGAAAGLFGAGQHAGAGDRDAPLARRADRMSGAPW